MDIHTHTGHTHIHTDDLGHYNGLLMRMCKKKKEEEMTGMEGNEDE